MSSLCSTRSRTVLQKCLTWTGWDPFCLVREMWTPGDSFCPRWQDFTNLLALKHSTSPMQLCKSLPALLCVFIRWGLRTTIGLHIYCSTGWTAVSSGLQFLRPACRLGTSPLPLELRESFQSLRVHPPFPHILNLVGYASADHRHPAQLKLASNYVHNWARSLFWAFMVEFYTETRVSL